MAELISIRLHSLPIFMLMPELGVAAEGHGGHASPHAKSTYILHAAGSKKKVSFFHCAFPSAFLFPAPAHKCTQLAAMGKIWVKEATSPSMQGAAGEPSAPAALPHPSFSKQI